MMTVCMHTKTHGKYKAFKKQKSPLLFTLVRWWERVVNLEFGIDVLVEIVMVAIVVKVTTF